MEAEAQVVVGIDLPALQRRIGKLTSLLEVAKAMTALRNFDQLLLMILDEAVEVVEADRCSLFLVDRDRGELWSKIAQGIETKEIRFPIGKGIAGQVAETGEVINIPDAYADPRFNRAVDAQTGYRTATILCVPMKDVNGEVVGVLQALNRRTGRFVAEDEELLMALGGQAASAIQNAQLHEEIQRLFEGFVKASVVAIEARDPTTAGHSERVARLTVSLAQAAERGATGRYQGVKFSRDELQEIRYAALLHDFGKVGVREHVLVKAMKLLPHELDLIRARFDFIRRSVEGEAMRRKLDLYANPPLNSADMRAGLLAIDERQREEMHELEGFYEFITACNKPTVLAEGSFEKLAEVAARTFADARGEVRPFLSMVEVANLSIRRGSLSLSERKEIESHVTHTYRFLTQIPWTRGLRRVPDIAYGHHEKLDGKGYPRGLPPDQISPQTRMMTISDIYDALTASDRPYKRAVPHEKALDILRDESKSGFIDSELLRVFIEAEVSLKARAP